MTTTASYPNPFILERADPYVTKGPDGYYYFTASYPMKSDNDPEGYDPCRHARLHTVTWTKDGMPILR